jgi:hypothetical protein
MTLRAGSASAESMAISKFTSSPLFASMRGGAVSATSAFGAGVGSKSGIGVTTAC